jgi:hypothetical protein
VGRIRTLISNVSFPRATNVSKPFVSAEPVLQEVMMEPRVSAGIISALTILAVATMTLNSPQAQAPHHRAAGFGNDVLSCAANAPCFQSVYQHGSDITFEFNVVRNWDVYNVRLPDGEQFENTSGQFTLHHVRPQYTYQISVQGCNKHTFSRSDCSAWVTQKFTAK